MKINTLSFTICGEAEYVNERAAHFMHEMHKKMPGNSVGGIELKYINGVALLGTRRDILNISLREFIDRDTRSILRHGYYPTLRTLEHDLVDQATAVVSAVNRSDLNEVRDLIETLEKVKGGR
jgi:hypothetical protein